jgi:hypothetical protein
MHALRARIPRCAGSSSGPKCFQALGPRACYRVPYSSSETLKREAPVAPGRVKGGLSGSPGSGLEQAKDPTPVIPAGIAAAECPEEA